MGPWPAPAIQVLLVVTAVPPLLAATMPSSDDRACGCVARHSSDYGTRCRALSPISRSFALLLLLRLLLGRRLLLGLGLLLRLCRW